MVDAVRRDQRRSVLRDSSLPVVPGAGPVVRYVLAALRIALGWLFLWTFLDAMFGLGHDTPAAQSWLHGGSPTQGLVGSVAHGPFADLHHALAGGPVADALFMTSMLGLGVSLLLGVALRPAAAVGALVCVLLWTVVLPPPGNPLLDGHLVGAAVLVLLALTQAGDTLGLGFPWAATATVRRSPWLR